MIRRFLFLLLLLPSLACADAYSSKILSLSPCWYWRMDAASGTTETSLGSASGSDGTYQASPALNATGIPALVDKAVTFASASSQYMNWSTGGGTCASGNKGFCASGTLQDTTVIAWIKKTTDISMSVISRAATSNFSWVLFSRNTGTAEVTVWQIAGANYLTSGVSTSTACLAASGWCMIAGKITASTPKAQVYVNGVPDSSSTTTSGTCNEGGTFDLARRGDNTNYADATIDEVAVFTSLVSDADIALLYTLGAKLPSHGGMPFSARRDWNVILGPESWSVKRGSLATFLKTGTAVMGMLW